MWRHSAYHALAFLAALVWPPLSVSDAALPFGLRQTFAREASVCHALYATNAASEACRAYDVKCPGKIGTYGIDDGPLDANGSMADNAYGYTKVHYLAKNEPRNENRKAPDPDPETTSLDELVNALPEGKAVVFLDRFEGDRHARLLEMWVVDNSGLKDLTLVPLPPTDPKAMFIDRERNAGLLENLLKRGYQLTSEWSPMVVHDNSMFFVERECSGQWVYGGYYACNRVIKLTFKKIDAGKATAYCQLSAPRIAREKTK